MQQANMHKCSSNPRKWKKAEWSLLLFAKTLHANMEMFARYLIQHRYYTGLGLFSCFCIQKMIGKCYKGTFAGSSFGKPENFRAYMMEYYCPNVA